jgi:endonuclease/exonuclease/phosphatase family metal-dependent hydrolase
VSLLVRTWNVFHGNAAPPERRGFLREMVRLVTADDPDVVCLQEVPVWALKNLEAWSGMQAVGAVARRPRLRSAELGGWITEIHHGLLRSALTGEAGAILVAPRFAVDALRASVVSHGGLRRIVHGLRLDGRVFVANFHISGNPDQLRRVVELVDAEPRAIVAGDANIPSASLPGFSAPLARSIDQIFVRGLPSSAPVAWPDDRRRVQGRLMSDHAPVEIRVG